MTRWLGPYAIEKSLDNGIVQIRTINEEGIPFLVNGYRLKVYKNPFSNKEFINSISKAVMVIEGVSTSIGGSRDFFNHHYVPHQVLEVY